MERRKFERRVLEELAARLSSKADGIEVDYCPINISKQGLSVFTSAPLPVGGEFVLELAKKPVRLRLQWSRPKEGDPAFFRNGFSVIEPSDQLDELIKEELGG